ncbi:MAG: c-type cytochrome [candidate division NC10 bacterium]|nr:c-type cytochrome [candidate division NC10 bacterium]
MGKAQPCPLWGRVTGAKVAVIASLALAATLLAGRLSAGTEAASQVLAQGKDVYQRKCAVCHGTEGRGDGSAAYLLYPKPRDFTSGKFKIRSTLTLPTDQDLFRTITNGIPGTSMPSWANLSEQDRWTLVAYVKSLSESFETQPPGEPVTLPQPPKRTQKLMALGKQFYKEAGCFDCHGTSGRGDGPSSATLKDEWGYPIVPYDFTIPGRMKGGFTVKDVYRTLQAGIGGTPMPSYADSLTEEQTWALAYYVLSLPKQPLAEPAPRKPGTIVSKFMKGELPLDPFASAWAKLPFARVHLEPLWIRTQEVEEVRVKSLQNGNEIAFLLEWDDAIADQELLKSEDFRDAVAVQFPVGTKEPSYTMGDQQGLVNIWHWKADWEADLQRYRDLQDRYPGMWADAYWFQRGVPSGVEAAKAPTSSHDPTYLAGWGAGNPLSNPVRRSSVEDLNAVGFGTLTSQPSEEQDVRGKGVWQGGKWRVVMIRKLRTEDGKDAQFIPGQTTSIAFAVWDGAQGDRDGQKAVSTWQRLQIEKGPGR